MVVIMANGLRIFTRSSISPLMSSWGKQNHCTHPLHCVSTYLFKFNDFCLESRPISTSLSLHIAPRERVIPRINSQPLLHFLPYSSRHFPMPQLSLFLRTSRTSRKVSSNLGSALSHAYRLISSKVLGSFHITPNPQPLGSEYPAWNGILCYTSYVWSCVFLCLWCCWRVR